MQHVSTFEELAGHLAGRSTSATIGVFDGVHLGHQALLQKAIELARASDTTPLAITFANHPLSVLAPPYTPRRLITPQRKVELIRKAGINEILMLDFTPEFAATPAREFIARDLVGLAGVKNLICGYDFTFGAKGAGNLQLLHEHGSELGFHATCVDPVTMNEQIVKSTHIRDLLSRGKVERAAQHLSRPHELPGTVIPGHQRGRTIGFPTANLAPPDHYQQPGMGVYICGASLPGRDKQLPAMVNIGTNPTFENDTPSIEAYIINFDDDILGQHLTLHFLTRLRDEQKFPGIDALVAQLNRDREATEQFWSNRSQVRNSSQ